MDTYFQNGTESFSQPEHCIMFDLLDSGEIQKVRFKLLALLPYY
jgi:hypothetical protein